MSAIKTKHPLTTEQQLWMVEQFGLPGKHNNPNPCVKLYGFGPDGAKCKGCQLLTWHTTARKYFKCSLRNFTHGPGSDHRANWTACQRFVPLPARTQTPGRT